jgi:lipid A ethanolaminephosphotransferase
MISSSFRRLWHWRPEVGSEWLIAGVCLYVALMFNDAFWSAVLAGRSLGEVATWRVLLATSAALCALHYIALACFSHRMTVKPLLMAILVASAMAGYYIDHYAVFMDPDMLRNILHTEYKEARELVTFGFVGHTLLWTLVPMLLLWRVRILQRPLLRAVSMRVLSVLAAVVLVAGGLGAGYRDLSALMRNQKEVRYLVTPGNLIYSAARVALADVRKANQVIVPVGVDAHVAPRLTSGKPRLLIIVVGETVRAQNWGLNGYRRDTTPQLRALNVVNFSDVQACGSATEVSLPCMFSAVGRRDYDEPTILSHESLLHVLNHAGVRSLWRDNQTGCKGVCAGLPFQQWNDAEVAGLCRNGLCFDDILLHDLQKDIDAESGDLVVVLHPLGNHGPNYYLRYPQEFRRYTPTCDSAELGDCSSEQIVNSYDNAVLYADHFVSETIRLLERQTARDSALIYVSDHGESLGEQGIFLHGIPYAIAPDVQTAVPMITWLSPGLVDSADVDVECLRRESAMPLSHDNLFHSTLGLLDVQTKVYEPSLDLFRSCRSQLNQHPSQVALD